MQWENHFSLTVIRVAYYHGSCLPRPLVRKGPKEQGASTHRHTRYMERSAKHLSTTEDPTKDATEVRYSALLEKAWSAITPILRQGAEKCLAAIPGRSQLREWERQELDGGVHGAYEWLAGCLAEELETAIGGAQKAARQALKVQAATFAMKLETSRTAGAVMLEAQAAEMEAAMHRKTEEALKAFKGAEGDLLAAAHREIEIMQQEVTRGKLTRAARCVLMGSIVTC